MKLHFTMWWWLTLLCISIVPASPLNAQEKPWQIETELSYVQTGGNTDVTTFSGKNTLKYRFSDQWTGAWVLGALYGATDGEKNAERYYTDVRLDYQLDKRIYLYGLGGWFQDKFAGFDSRLYLGPGAGYHVLTGDRHLLSVEAGLSYASEQYTDDTGSDFIQGRLFGTYAFFFSAKAKFSQTFEYLHHFDDAQKFHVNAIAGLISTLTDIISVKLSYEINYANKPVPADLKQTDTIFTVAMVVNL